MFRNPLTGKSAGIARYITTAIVFIFAVTQACGAFCPNPVFAETASCSAGTAKAFEPTVIPPAFGSVSERFGNDRIPSFFLIKDLHCHYEAQMNIAKIISVLTRAFNSNLVLVEGAAGPVDTALIASFPNRKIKDAVARQFVKKGQVTGPEFYSIYRKKHVPLDLFGIETESVYIENLKAYRETITNREQTDLISELLLEALDRIKKASYPEDLLRLDNAITLQENGKLSFVDFSKHLIQAAQTHLGTNALDHYPNLKLLDESVAREKHVDTAVLERERSALMKLLEQNLVKEDLTLLLKKSLAYRLGKITAADFFTSIEASVPDGIRTDVRKRFSSFFEYIEILKLQAKISNEDLFNEATLLEETIKNVLFTADFQREVDRTSKLVKTLRKLFHLEVTRDELDFFHANEQNFQFSSLISTLRNYAGESGTDLPALLLENAFSVTAENTVASAIAFYAAALKRDKILIENAITRMRSTGAPSSIMLSGGFHTRGITGILKKNNHSYVVITPLVASLPEDSTYKAIMLDQRLEAQLSGKNNALAAPSNFSQLVFNRFVAALVQKTMAEAMVSMENANRKADVNSLFESWQNELLERDAAPAIRKAFENFKQTILDIPVFTGIPIPGQQAILDLINTDEFTARLTVTYLEKVNEKTSSADSLTALNFAKTALKEKQDQEAAEQRLLAEKARSSVFDNYPFTKRLVALSTSTEKKGPELRDLQRFAETLMQEELDSLRTSMEFFGLIYKRIQHDYPQASPAEIKRILRHSLHAYTKHYCFASSPAISKASNVQDSLGHGRYADNTPVHVTADELLLIERMKDTMSDVRIARMTQHDKTAESIICTHIDAFLFDQYRLGMTFYLPTAVFPGSREHAKTSEEASPMLTRV